MADDIDDLLNDADDYIDGVNHSDITRLKPMKGRDDFLKSYPDTHHSHRHSDSHTPHQPDQAHATTGTSGRSNGMSTSNTACTMPVSRTVRLL